MPQPASLRFVGELEGRPEGAARGTFGRVEVAEPEQHRQKVVIHGARHQRVELVRKSRAMIGARYEAFTA
jgi:hypothetical protein